MKHFATQLSGNAPLGILSDAQHIRPDKQKTLEKFSSWCSARGYPQTVTMSTYLEFRKELSRSHSSVTVRGKMRHLYDEGISGPDLDLRDFLFATFPDRRTPEEMMLGPWWPHIPRILASNMKITNRKCVIRELDYFFRWKQRTEKACPSKRLSDNIFGKRLAPATMYCRLTHLCRGLDTVLPRDPDLAKLRNIHKELHCKIRTPVCSVARRARRVAEVEVLLQNHSNPITGKPISEYTRDKHRQALNLHYDLLKAAKRPLVFDRPALDIFADHAHAKLALWLEQLAGTTEGPDSPEKSRGWCRMSVWAKCQSIAPFIADSQLKREWYDFAEEFKREAKRNGDIKRKERALAEKPMDLEGLFLRATELCKMADQEMDIARRYGIQSVIGALGIFLFYPLRVGDLLGLRLDRELSKTEGKWLLSPNFTGKTNDFVDPLVLPLEANPLIEACLLRGSDRSSLTELYERSERQPFLKSTRRDRAYHRGAFSALFKRWVGHSPHVVRSIWCDGLIAAGADRSTIGAMLQHRSLISQEHYEVLAAKIRRNRAMDVLREISDRLTV